MTCEAKHHQTSSQLCCHGVNATIHVSTSRRAYELPLSVLTGNGSLTTADGHSIGECEFEVLHRKRGYEWLDADEICSVVDEHSALACHVAESLTYLDPCLLEVEFNSGCLLIANRIHIEPTYRGKGLWKRLYFVTMAKTIEKIRRRPLNYWFKVFPLDYEHPPKVGVDPQNLGRAIRDLEMLYAIHLGAKRLEVPAEYGRFMSAPLPPSLTKF